MLSSEIEGSKLVKNWVTSSKDNFPFLLSSNLANNSLDDFISSGEIEFYNISYVFLFSLIWFNREISGSNFEFRLSVFFGIKLILFLF